MHGVQKNSHHHFRKFHVRFSSCKIGIIHSNMYFRISKISKFLSPEYTIPTHSIIHTDSWQKLVGELSYKHKVFSTYD